MNTRFAVYDLGQKQGPVQRQRRKAGQTEEGAGHIQEGAEKYPDGLHRRIGRCQEEGRRQAVLQAGQSPLGIRHVRQGDQDQEGSSERDRRSNQNGAEKGNVNE